MDPMSSTNAHRPQVGLARTARRAFVAVLLAASIVAVALPAAADDYEPQWAGHPLRVVAYVTHPIGVALDVLIFRPAHWVVSRSDSMARLFGHERYER